MHKIRRWGTNVCLRLGAKRDAPAGLRRRRLKVLDRLLADPAVYRAVEGLAGVAPETINRIENADAPRSTTALTVRRLATALEVGPRDLLARADGS
jgi:transcriptional regulator with XRE-family HTH domain